MKTKLLVITAVFSLALSGCILDSLETINQNLPISREIVIDNQPISEFTRTFVFDLNTSDTYQDYENDIKKIEYTSLSFRTTELNIPALEGDLEVEVLYGGETTVFTKRIKPEDYKTTPLVFSLPAAEVAKINEYLAGPNGGRAFTVNVTLNNLTPSSGMLTLRGYFDAVFNFEAEI